MRQIFIFIFFLLLIANVASADNLVQMDFANASIDPDSWALELNGYSYACIKKGSPTVPPRFVDGGLNGDKAIRFELDATSGPGPDNGRDKVNIKVVSGKDSYAPSFDDRTVYFSFAMKFDGERFETPTSGRNYVLVQFWQGAPFGPPLAMLLDNAKINDADPRIEFEVRNNETGGAPGAKIIHLHPKDLKFLKRGQWYNFKMGVKLGTRDDGQIKIWINGAQEISWAGSVGYDPSSSAADLGFKTGKTDRYPNEHLEVYFGPYRDRQESTQVIYYDHIAYGYNK